MRHRTIPSPFFTAKKREKRWVRWRKRSKFVINTVYCIFLNPIYFSLLRKIKKQFIITQTNKRPSLNFSLQKFHRSVPVQLLGNSKIWIIQDLRVKMLISYCTVFYFFPKSAISIVKSVLLMVKTEKWMLFDTVRFAVKKARYWHG